MVDLKDKIITEFSHPMPKVGELKGGWPVEEDGFYYSIPRKSTLSDADKAETNFHKRTLTDKDSPFLSFSLYDTEREELKRDLPIFLRMMRVGCNGMWGTFRILLKRGETMLLSITKGSTPFFPFLTADNS